MYHPHDCFFWIPSRDDEFQVLSHRLPHSSHMYYQIQVRARRGRKEGRTRAITGIEDQYGKGGHLDSTKPDSIGDEAD